VIRRRDAREARCGQRRDRDRVTVVRVVLVRAAGPKHPHPRRQRRGHVQHPFTGADELLRKQIADTAGAFHRPRTRLEPVRPRQQLRDLRLRRAHLDRGELHVVAVDRHRGVGPLVRIDTDHHRHRVVLPDHRSARTTAGTPDFGGSCARTSFEPHRGSSGGRAASFVSQTRTRDGRQFESQPTRTRRYGNPQRPTQILNQAVTRSVRLVGSSDFTDKPALRARSPPTPCLCPCQVPGGPEWQWFLSPIDARAARRAAQQQLAAEVPAVVLAEMLGIAIATAVDWVHAAGGDWANYAAITTTDTDPA